MVVISDLLKKPDLSASDLSRMKHADLKQICKEKGLSMAGTKSDLITRFLKSLNPNADSTVKDAQDVVAEEELLRSPQPKDPVVDAPSAFEVTESSVTSGDPELKEDDSCEPPEKKQKFIKIEAPLTNASVEKKKLEERIKRFGTVNEEQKKISRAERFHTGADKGADATAGGDNALKKRAERFNLPVSSTTAAPQKSPAVVGSDEALKKRMERFGQLEQQQQQTPATDALTKRAAKFGQVSMSDSSDAKQKRAQRFGLK